MFKTPKSYQSSNIDDDSIPLGGKCMCISEAMKLPKANNTHREACQSEQSAQYSPRVVAPKSSPHPEVGLCWQPALSWRKDGESADKFEL